MRYYLIFILLLSVHALKAQYTRDQAKFELMVNMSVGQAFSLTDFKSGQFSDGLLRFDETSSFMETFSVTGILNGKYGISIKMINLFKSPGELENYPDEFQSQMFERFGSVYLSTARFISESQSAINYSTTALFGLTRKFSVEKFDFYPSISIGMRSLEIMNYSARFKTPNSNRIFQYTIESNSLENRSQEILHPIILSPSIRVGYKVSEDLSIQFDVQHFYYKLDVSYTETVEDLYTLEKTVTRYDYPKGIHFMNLAAGVIFHLK